MNSVSNRTWTFWLQMLYLVILGWLALGSFSDAVPGVALPAKLGSVPTGVVWFGAVGGVLISLTAITEHRYDWDPRYWNWHVARPFVGAAVAVIAVLIVQAGILATGTQPTAPGTTTTVGGTAVSTTTDIFYYLVAFLVGYREETFRGMIKRLGDVVLTSEGAGVAPSLQAIEPARAAAAGGSEVVIKGSGLKGVQVVRFGTTESPTIRVQSDAEVTAKVPPGTAGTTVAVTVITEQGSSTAIQAFTYD